MTLPTEPVRQPHRTPCASCDRKVLAMRRALSEGHRGQRAIAVGDLLCASCAAWASAGPVPEMVPVDPQELARVLAFAERVPGQGRRAA